MQIDFSQPTPAIRASLEEAATSYTVISDANHTHASRCILSTVALLISGVVFLLLATAFPPIYLIGFLASTLLFASSLGTSIASLVLVLKDLSASDTALHLRLASRTEAFIESVKQKINFSGCVDEIILEYKKYFKV